MKPWGRAVAASAGVVAVVFALDVTLAEAQSSGRPGRPYRGLFGSGMDNAEQSLVATASLGGGYDTNVLAAALGRQRVFRPGGSGGVTQGSAGLNYALSLDRVQMGASAGTSAQYYPAFSETLLNTHNMSIGGRVRLLDRPAITANQTVSYQPFTFLGPVSSEDAVLIGQIPPPDTSFAPTLEHYLSYQGGIQLDQPLSRRVSLSSRYQYRKSDRPNRDFLFHGVQADLRFAISRYASLITGYRVFEGRYTDGRVYRNHTPIVTVDMARPLSLTRRTMLSFGAGATAIENRDRTQVRATGNAALTHEVGRSWQAFANYGRGLRYLETFDEPIFSDTASVGFGGLVNRRVQVTTIVAASKGQVGFTGQRSFDTVSATAGASVALNRFSSLSVNYFHYRYGFDQDVALPAGVLNRFARHGIRANINFWAPLAATRRRP